MSATIYGPYTTTDGTILNENVAAGQWQVTNYGDFGDLGSGMQVNADITERYQTVKDGPFKFRGNMFVKRMVQPDRIPIPPGAQIAVDGTDVFLVPKS